MNTGKKRARFVCLTGLAGLVVFGCDDTAVQPAPTAAGGAAVTAASSQPRAAVKDRIRNKLQRHAHSRRGARGIKGIFAQALRVLKLKEDQKTKIEKMRDEFDPRQAGKQTRDDFKKALAQGIKAGKIDDGLMKTKIEAISKQKDEHRAKWLKAVASLHGILTAPQRKSLADEMTKKNECPMGNPHCMGEHDDVATKDRAAVDGAKPGRTSRRHKRMHGSFERMLRRLALSEEQRSKINEARKSLKSTKLTDEEKKKRHETMKQHRAAFWKAFTADKFDPQSLPTKGHHGRHVARLERKVAEAKAIVPILTETQRDKLAEIMLTSRSFRGLRRFGRKGGPMKISQPKKAVPAAK